MYIRKLLLLLLTLVAALVFSFASLQKNEAHPFHTPLKKISFSIIFMVSTRNPIDSDQYFLGSIRCKGCHGFDTLHQANIDANGVDINLYDDWESSMMANSAKDPFWRAKVSHEILVIPVTPLNCKRNAPPAMHPWGILQAIYHGATSFTIDDLNNDTLGLNGVACGGCHEIGTQNLGSVFSGNIPYDTSKKEFGPFLNPLAGPMQLYVGLTPVLQPAHEHLAGLFFMPYTHRQNR